MKVIQVVPKLDLAGAEIMCENLSVSLKRNDVDVLVVSLYNHKTIITDRLEKQGVRVLFLEKKQGIDLSIIRQLYKLFLVEKPDVVHTHINVLQYVTIAGYFAKVKKIVHTVHSIANKEAKPIRQKIYFYLYKSKKIIPVALSKEIKTSVIKRYKLPESRVPVIYNGIQLDNCIPKISYKETSKLIFIHIGRFADVKNHSMLVNAFYALYKKCPNVELWLVGDGPNFNKIKNQVDTLGMKENIQFLGLKSNVYVILNQADVFVLPSKYEGMPMTIIEAMGSAMPIIASNVGGIPSMLSNNKDALLVDVSEESIYKAMIKMTDYTLRERLGKNAFVKAKDFSSNNMAKEYMKIYEM